MHITSMSFQKPVSHGNFMMDLIIVGFLIGWPRLKWVVTDSKYLTKPSKDWQPHIPTANTDTAYIEVRSCASCDSVCVCVFVEYM